LHWVEGLRKTSALVIALRIPLLRTDARAPVLQVILDNYRIHDRKIVQAAWRGWGGRIQLHFLPPYCPNDNKIERLWQDLHANVTRNHPGPNRTALRREVRSYLRKRYLISASSLSRSQFCGRSQCGCPSTDMMATDVNRHGTLRISCRAGCLDIEPRNAVMPARSTASVRSALPPPNRLLIPLLPLEIC
jgi:transposase